MVIEEQWVQRYRGTVGTAEQWVQRDSGYRVAEKHWSQRNSGKVGQKEYESGNL